MKKTGLILFLTFISVQAFSQQGDLSIGAKGGFISSNSDINLKDVLYGFDLAYHLSYPLEVAFTGLMNPNVSHDNSKLAVYSTNLDFRLFLIHQREWSDFATGPALGGQFYIVDNKTENLGADKALGFNIGWHARVNLTDNIKINGGWRYTNVKAKNRQTWWSDAASFDMSHHFLYIGVAYTFELKFN